MESNVQNAFLHKLKDTQEQVSLFTTNGFRMIGVITAFDQDTVVIKDGNRHMIVYKHAISTIAPDSKVAIQNRAEDETV